MPLVRRITGNESLIHVMVQPHCTNGDVPATGSDCHPKISKFELVG